ncbi:MAG: glycerophosphodiester phosphodiesterase family protein [Rhodospirillales bacterium]
MKKPQGIPFVIGHRGACGHAPENTLPSFRKAAELGVRWVELDVQLSADGVPFLLHDDRLERTTDGEGEARETIWSELAALDAGRWFDEAFTGTRLLRLDDAIGHLDTLGLGMNIELKSTPGRERDTAKAVCATLSKEWPASLPKPLLSSFSLECVAFAAECLPDCARAMLYDELPEDWRDQCAAVGAAAVHVWHESITPDQIRPVLDAGYPVRAFTVNQRTRAAELGDQGFAGIFCDFPERMSGVGG